MLNNSWRDSAWSNVKLVRNGIDGDVKESRELVFGKNMIDIRQKTVPQLLIDEVSHCSKVLIRLIPPRLFIPSMSSKLPVSYFGQPIITFTTLPAFSLSL